MTITGTPILQNAAVVKLNLGGSLTDYSDQVQSSTLTARVTVGSYYVLASRDEVQSTGAVPRGYDLSLTVIKTNNSNDLYAKLMTNVAGTGTAGNLSTIAAELYDPDSSSGSEKWSGNFVLTGAGTPVTKTANSGDVEVCTFTFRSTGAVTRSIVA